MNVCQAIHFSHLKRTESRALTCSLSGQGPGDDLLGTILSKPVALGLAWVCENVGKAPTVCEVLHA